MPVPGTGIFVSESWKESPQRVSPREILRRFFLCSLLVWAASAGCHRDRALGQLERRLVDIIEHRYPTRAMLSGSGPLVLVRGSGGSEPARANNKATPATTPPDLRRIHDSLRSAARDHPGDIRILRLQALWELAAAGDDNRWQRAEGLLLRGAARDSNTESWRNDLAWIQLVHSVSQAEPERFVVAFDHLSRLAGLGASGWGDVSHLAPETRVNLALALEGLGLWTAAGETWRSLTGVVTWQAAARRELDRIESQVVSRKQEAPTAPGPCANPYRAERTLCLLAVWARAQNQGPPGLAGESLTEATVLANQLATDGSPLFVDLLTEIEPARIEPAKIEPARIEGTSQRTATTKDLAAGLLALAEARADRSYSTCGPGLESARELLRRADSGAAVWAELDAAVCAYFAKDFATADRLLRGLAAISAKRGYPSLQGRVWWIEALVRMAQGRFAAADDLYGRAIDTYQTVGEPGHVVYLQGLRAKVLELVGMRQAAWRSRLPALARRHLIADPERRFTLLEGTVFALREQGRQALAWLYLDEQLEAAHQAAALGEQGRDLLAYTHLDRSKVATELGLAETAQQELGTAEHFGNSLPPGHESRERLRHEIATARITQHPSGGIEGALATIDNALRFFDRPGGAPGDRVEALALYRERARIELRAGHTEAAQKDLERGITEVERQRAEAGEPEERARFLARSRELFATLLELQLDTLGDARAALLTLERSERRLLLDDQADEQRPARSLPPLELETLLATEEASDLAIVRLARLDHRLLLWTLRGSALEFEQRPWPTDLVAEPNNNTPGQMTTGQMTTGQMTTGQMTAGQMTAGQMTAESLAELATVVLPRSLHDLPANSRLLLVPSNGLAGLPFAALPVGPGGEALVERFSLSFAPSLMILQAGAASPQPIAPQNRSALFVGDPAFPRSLFPRLQPLEESREGIVQQAALHPRSTVLMGEKATAAALLAALPHHQLLHVSSHGITDLLRPENNGLLLAAPTGAAESEVADQALLTAADLRAEHLGSLELVILAGCRTTFGAYPDTSEIAGLAASLLARGVPRVLTTLWPIEDTLAARFFLELHRQLAAGIDPETALRRAQLTFLRSGDPALDHPSAWAGYQLFRGSLRKTPSLSVVSNDTHEPSMFRSIRETRP